MPSRAKHEATDLDLVEPDDLESSARELPNLVGRRKALPL
jgi:hypothetical protein